MPGYYVYVIDRDGHVQKRYDVVCENDEQAIARAKQLAGGRAVELWQQARKVADFKPIVRGD